MRIPISESELGYWYPIGNGYYFIQDCFEYCYARGRGHRLTTFAEFKKALPYTKYSSGANVRYRVKNKKDQYNC